MSQKAKTTEATEEVKDTKVKDTPEKPKNKRAQRQLNAQKLDVEKAEKKQKEEEETLQKAEDLRENLKKRKTPRPSVRENHLLAKAGIIKTKRDIVVVEDWKAEVTARKDRIAIEQGIRDHTVNDSPKCFECKAEKPGWALPWAVVFSLLKEKYLEEKKIDLTKGPFESRLAHIAAEDVEEISYCEKCKPLTEKHLATLPEAKRHPNNAILHPRDSAVDFWLKTSVNAMKAEDDRDLETLNRDLDYRKRGLEKSEREEKRLREVLEERVALQEKKEASIGSRFAGLAQSEPTTEKPADEAEEVANT